VWVGLVCGLDNAVCEEVHILEFQVWWLFSCGLDAAGCVELYYI
jgi:hypothetical protein